MSKTMINQYDLAPEMAPVPEGSHRCSICESESNGTCWCAKTKAAAEYLVAHEVYNPQGFLDAYEQAAKVRLADVID